MQQTSSPHYSFHSLKETRTIKKLSPSHTHGSNIKRKKNSHLSSPSHIFESSSNKEVSLNSSQAQLIARVILALSLHEPVSRVTKTRTWKLEFLLYKSLASSVFRLNPLKLRKLFQMKAGLKLCMMICFSFRGMMSRLWYLDRRVSTSSAQSGYSAIKLMRRVM
nr:uncharacterized protein LOC112006123 [Quercus suber]